MAAAVKALLYAGAILLLGAGILPRFIGPGLTGPALAGRLRWGARIGALLVAVASALDVAATLHGVLGYVDVRLAWSYVLNTRHGHATALRLGLVVLALVLRRRGPAVAYAAVGVLLLGTFSWTSHAAAMGGAAPLAFDLVHFAAAAAWAGPLIYLALLPAWQEQAQAMRATLRRVSAVGLASVALLALSGTYTALVHLQEPGRFVASDYGLALGLKLIVFASIVGVAAVNRLWLLPSFMRTAATSLLRSTVRLEAALLLAVFALTGLLTTSALPHEPAPATSVLDNLVGFVRFLLGD